MLPMRFLDTTPSKRSNELDLIMKKVMSIHNVRGVKLT